MLSLFPDENEVMLLHRKLLRQEPTTIRDWASAYGWPFIEMITVCMSGNTEKFQELIDLLKDVRELLESRT